MKNKLLPSKSIAIYTLIMVKSEIDLAIELRNAVAARIVEKKANILYWKYIKQHSKHETSDRIDAIRNISINEIEIEKDTIFLKLIDGMLKGGLK